MTRPFLRDCKNFVQLALKLYDLERGDVAVAIDSDIRIRLGRQSDQLDRITLGGGSLGFSVRIERQVMRASALRNADPDLRIAGPDAVHIFRTA